MRTLETYQYEHPDLGMLTKKKIVTRDNNGNVVSEFFVAPCTAEEWLAIEGLTPLRLVTLLYLETKLASANKSSAKLSALRSWLDGLLASFAQDPSPKEDWTLAPFPFEEVTTDAFLALA